MAAKKGTPAWYLEGGNDLHRKSFDTEAATGVVEEARSLLFSGQTPVQVRKIMQAKGAGIRAIDIVARASKLEWEATVGAASTDIEAGQFQTPHVAAARRLAMEITKEDPSGNDFRKKLASHGASDALANFLANDPDINRAANQTGRTMLVLGLIGLAASVFGAFAVFSDKPDGSAVSGLLMIFGASVTGVWRGAAGMRRKAGSVLMPAVKGSAAWYLEGGEDVSFKRFDTEAAQGVVREARELIFRGQKPDDVGKELTARGAKDRAKAIVAYASQLEWNAVVKAASTDFDAGQTASPHVALARRLAVEITRGDPTGKSFAATLAVHGASEKFAAWLAEDPDVAKTAHRGGWIELGGGAIGLAFCLIAFMSYNSRGETVPWQMIFIVLLSLGAIGKGFDSLGRRARKQ